MSKEKKWLIAACVLIGTGALTCVLSMAALGFDYKKLGTVVYVTKTYDVGESFRNIRMDADIERIAIVPSTDGSCRVQCHEEEKAPHQVRVEGDTLTVERMKNGWHLGIITDSPEITVYLPESRYGTLSIEGDTGDVAIDKAFTFDSIQVALDTGDVSCLASAVGDISITTVTGEIAIADLSASEMGLESNTGRIELSDVELTGDLGLKENTGNAVLKNVFCKTFTSDGDTGKLTMTNVIAAETFHLERETGKIVFDGCDAESIEVKTNTGSVTGTLLSDKVFFTETDTGSVNVPKTLTGGRCEITTDTGNIRIEIAGKKQESS